MDQVIAAKIGRETRFASLQVGVSQECFGESIQRNMSWVDRDRPLPPETVPHRLFDRLFGGNSVALVDITIASWARLSGAKWRISCKAGMVRMRAEPVKVKARI